MFGLFKRRLPISTFARVDIELLLRRNVEVMGRETVLSADIITNIDELALDSSSSERLIDSAAAQVAPRMKMQRVAIDFDSDDQRTHIGEDPLRMVVEVANQHAHQFWLAQPSPRPLDHHPRTTTLLPIACGFGVLASNAALQESNWNAAGYTGWSMTRFGYYSAIEIGYALALIARLRGETDPVWMRSLRLDAAKTARDALTFFAKHAADGGSLLFDSQRIPSSDRPATELTSWLAGDDATFTMASAYALAKLDSLPAIATGAALRLTNHKDAEIVVLAARLLGSGDESDPRISDRLEELVANRSGTIALAALHSASRRKLPIPRFKSRIEKLLSDRVTDVVPVVELIANHAAELSSLSPAVCRQAGLAIRYQDAEAAKALLSCLAKMVDDPIGEVERWIRNPDTRTAAIKIISSETEHDNTARTDADRD